MAVFIGNDTCWLCAGLGQITTGATECLIACGMCSGSGTSDITPSTTDEMVSMITAMPNLERHTLMEAEIDAAVAEFGQIIEQALREIDNENEESDH